MLPLQKVWLKIKIDILSVLIWIQTIWHSDIIPEDYFVKLILKKSADNKKAWKITQHTEH